MSCCGLMTRAVKASAAAVVALPTATAFSIFLTIVASFEVDTKWVALRERYSVSIIEFNFYNVTSFEVLLSILFSAAKSRNVSFSYGALTLFSFYIFHVQPIDLDSLVLISKLPIFWYIFVEF